MMGGNAMDQTHMEGKIVLVTGASDGVGKEAALALASKGATMILACRNLVKGEKVLEEIQNQSGNKNVSLVHIELSDLKSVERCANEVLAGYPRIDVLINNAGGIFSQRQITPQGFEYTFGVNYLSHYALTRLLAGHLKIAGSARVINVSSLGHKMVKDIKWDDINLEHNWGRMSAYGQSKLAQILFTRELASRCGKDGVVAHAVHPGLVWSNFYNGEFLNRLVDPFIRSALKHMCISSAEGAVTPIWLATSPEALKSNGLYWAKCKPQRPSNAATSEEGARKLWQLSERLVTEAGITLPEC